MPDWFDKLPADERILAVKKDPPDWMAPMLAVLTHEHFSHDDWIFERKLDGQRCLALRDGSGLRIMSRNRKVLNEKYPELVTALESQKQNRFVIDGEIVAFEGNTASFRQLQPRMHASKATKKTIETVPVYYYIFDLIYFDGYDITALPLRTRKKLLSRALVFDDPLRFTEHRNREGEAFLKEVCGSGWEGLIAKLADAAYVHGRSRHWLKFKCANEQEFVIGGYTDPQGARVGFGALLVGYYENDDLRYAGKIGTGFDNDLLRSLHRRLKSIERKTPPFADDKVPTKGIHWVSPRLVAQVGFTEWTEGGKLRHPRFLGLRDDKRPEEVVRETPEI